MPARTAVPQRQRPASTADPALLVLAFVRAILSVSVLAPRFALRATLLRGNTLRLHLRLRTPRSLRTHLCLWRTLTIHLRLWWTLRMYLRRPRTFASHLHWR